MMKSIKTKCNSFNIQVHKMIKVEKEKHHFYYESNIECLSNKLGLQVMIISIIDYSIDYF